MISFLLVAGAPAAAGSALIKPPAAFDTRGEQLVVEARLAREAGSFATAGQLLDAAAALSKSPIASILQERGLLARDKGHKEQALDLLKRAAVAAPQSSARVDQAAVLVDLGRWPEAVTVLRRAFEERGTGLDPEDLLADQRFAKLLQLAPYTELLEEMRASERGPSGHLQGRLDRLQQSVDSTALSLERLADWILLWRRLVTSQAAATIALILIGLLVTYGIGQFGLLRPPWTLVVGMLAAATMWHVLAVVMSDGDSMGITTVSASLGWVSGLWLVGIIARTSRQRLRARRGRSDPFAPAQLPSTLALLDELSSLGHKLMVVDTPEAQELTLAIRQATVKLREQLGSPDDV